MIGTPYLHVLLDQCPGDPLPVDIRQLTAPEIKAIERDIPFLLKIGPGLMATAATG